MKVLLFLPDIELTLDVEGDADPRSSKRVTAADLCAKGIEGRVISWGRSVSLDKTRLRPGLVVHVPAESILFASTDFKENGE